LSRASTNQANSLCHGRVVWAGLHPSVGRGSLDELPSSFYRPTGPDQVLQSPSHGRPWQRAWPLNPSAGRGSLPSESLTQLHSSARPLQPSAAAGTSLRLGPGSRRGARQGDLQATRGKAPSAAPPHSSDAATLPAPPSSARRSFAASSTVLLLLSLLLGYRALLFVDCTHKIQILLFVCFGVN
jgi:hypothetical protein